MVARRPSGASVAWPAVETAQVGGVCREVLVPGRLDPDVVEAAAALGQKVAEIAGARRRHGGGAVLVRGPAPGQRGGDPAPQLGPLDDGGRGDLAVREPRAGRARPAPRVDRAPAPPGGQRQRLRRRRRRGPRPAARPGPRRRGRPRPPLWQGRPAGTQTGARDGVRRRRRDWCGPGPGRPPLALGTPVPDGIELPGRGARR